MTQTCICVDAMGGDEPASVVLAGIEQALEQDADLSVLVAGPEDVVVPFCASHARAKALVASEVIAMDEHPADAVRTKRDSSIVRGCAAVKAGEADGFFSAGSTGAIFAAATLGVGRIKGIGRPALMTVFPGLSGHPTVCLDLGANADARPDMLVQFAKMGSIFSHEVLGVVAPRVALLSNGSEDTKGSAQAQSYFAALSADKSLTFVGNCEGNNLLTGDFDVIVSDGFTMNVALKSVEGTAKFMATSIKRAAAGSFRSKLGAGLMLPALKEIANELSGDEHGGAILLGLKAPVLIGHGATSVNAVCNGTLATARYVRAGLVAKIAESVV